VKDGLRPPLLGELTTRVDRAISAPRWREELRVLGHSAARSLRHDSSSVRLFARVATTVVALAMAAGAQYETFFDLGQNDVLAIGAIHQP
jgi:hypothetical protein